MPEAVITETPAIPTDAAGATARKSELMKDPAWVTRHSAGDTAARAEMSALNQVIVGPGNGPTDPHAVAMNSHVLERAREIGVSEDVIKQIQEWKPISQQEHDLVQRWKTSHMQDAEYLRKFNAGDYECRKQMFLANMTLSLPVAHNQ